MISLCKLLLLGFTELKKLRKCSVMIRCEAMTKEELLIILRGLRNRQADYGPHEDADDALIKYINDAEIKEAYSWVDSTWD